MANSVACNQGGTPLDENFVLGPEGRKPCPVCGSTARHFSVKVEGELFFREGGAASFAAARNTASLLLQAVIVPGARTDGGQLIEAVGLPWFDIIKSLKNDPSFAFRFKPRQWEEIIAGGYRKAGFDEVSRRLGAEIWEDIHCSQPSD